MGVRLDPPYKPWYRIGREVIYHYTRIEGEICTKS